MNTPTWRVPPRPHGDPADPFSWDWSTLPTLPPFRLAATGEPAVQQTAARLCADGRALYVRFDCDDTDIWGTYALRDDPIYNEEAVELFISAGEETPRSYFEFEVSPNGILFDAIVDNPSSTRRDMTANLLWQCPGLRAHVERDDPANRWTAILAVPWAGIAPAGAVPRIWRANLFRIERPRSGAAEFSCWSPTLATPADFHKPACFGTLIIE
jgi:hypothetical protein